MSRPCRQGATLARGALPPRAQSPGGAAAAVTEPCPRQKRHQDRAGGGAFVSRAPGRGTAAWWLRLAPPLSSLWRPGAQCCPPGWRDGACSAVLPPTGGRPVPATSASWKELTYLGATNLRCCTGDWQGAEPEPGPGGLLSREPGGCHAGLRVAGAVWTPAPQCLAFAGRCQGTGVGPNRTTPVRLGPVSRSHSERADT